VLYKAQAASGAAPGAAPGEAPASEAKKGDDVIDAEYTEEKGN
jgi:hypothetical protein